MHRYGIVPRKLDSRTIAVTSVFMAMVIALEVFPIVGLTDIRIPGVQFTLDWTGIPLVLIFFFFGTFLSLVGIGVMWAAIGYRNPIGALFKVPAELFKILALALGMILLRNTNVTFRTRIAVYAVLASLFCGIGMYFVNLQLLPILWGYEYDAAAAIALILVPWNIIQSLVNVLGGAIIYTMVPGDMKLQIDSIHEPVLQELADEFEDSF
ncbi:MAG: hypothetical protein ACFFEF_12685 [Candidatus Thorarchaeota archaeon]